MQDERFKLKSWIRIGRSPSKPAPGRGHAGGEHTTAVLLSDDSTARVAISTGAHLVAVRGPAELLGVHFALKGEDTTIGRQADCDITLNERSVSRVHATIRFDGGRWLIVHRSQTNPTLVNGEPIQDPTPIYDGDEIRIADQVGFRLDAPSAKRPSSSRAESLREAMQERIELEERIERDFVRDGTFLDVDVVDSYGLKTSEARPENIVVSFERFRELVHGCVAASRGQVLNSNGDEVMAFFDAADDALEAAGRLLNALAVFNTRENRLPRPFRVRMGVHTGRSAVDLRSGVAYSPVLDLAGHLQKAAPIDGLLLSDATRAALTGSHRMEVQPDTGKASVAAYVLHFGG